MCVKAFAKFLVLMNKSVGFESQFERIAFVLVIGAAVPEFQMN